VYVSDSMGAVTRSTRKQDSSPLILSVSEPSSVSMILEAGSNILNDAVETQNIVQVLQISNAIVQSLSSSNVTCDILGCSGNRGTCSGGKCYCGVGYSGSYCDLDVPINGGYSSWQPWSTCSVSCGRGSMVRSRLCNNPSPLNGGMKCEILGPSIEYQQCDMDPCVGPKVDGGYSPWSDWTSCDNSCPSDGYM
jgi:hypothetical protein